MSVAVFLQVRLHSARLPGKALFPLGDCTVIEHAMRALGSLPVDRRMLLTTEDSIGVLKNLANRVGWGVFAGPIDDVLARYVLASRELGIRTVIRATGDNPLVSAVMANAALALSRETDADYAAYRGMPIGAGVEVIRVEALEKAFKEARDPFEREHVCPFLYRHPEIFNIVISKAPSRYSAPKARITLDTHEDYDFLVNLYDSLYQGHALDLDRVIPYLRLFTWNQEDGNQVPYAG